jgi:hypothetical protein
MAVSSIASLIKIREKPDLTFTQVNHTGILSKEIGQQN